MFGRRSLLTTVLCMMCTSITCPGQTSVSFSNYNSPTGAAPFNVYTADLNNDGLPDLIQSIYAGPSGFLVSLAKGDGTFGPPATYAVPGASQNYTPLPMAFGDVNGDGNVDLVMPSLGGSQLLVYLGKGDGSFQAPRIENVGLPANTYINNESMVIADFNHDGKLDVAAITIDSSNLADVVILEGDGSGNFTYHGSVFSFPVDANQIAQITQMTTGDFDSDNNADLAFVTNDRCGAEPTACNFQLHVLWGDGQFGFSGAVPQTFNNGFSLAVGDVNSDGRSDIYGLDYDNNQVAIFYGETNRTFSTAEVPLSHPIAAPGGTLQPLIGMGDFNGDGYMDLVMQTNLGDVNPPTQLMFLLGTANPGTFTTQLVPLPGGFNTNPVVGDFNGDGKPDVAGVNTGANPTSGGPTTIVNMENGTSGGPWANCAYAIAGQGISECGPVAAAGSPVNFNASANSFGQLRKIELWVDGKKLGEQHHTWGGRAWFAMNQTLSLGNHSGTWVATNIDNTEQQANFTFTVGPPPCPLPQGSGVNLCTPSNEATVSNPMLVQATARMNNLARMEVWVDGAKKYTETPNNFISTLIPMRLGTHEVDVYAVDTGGNWSATIAHVTVRQ